MLASAIMPIKKFKVIFTEFIPEALEDGILYVSMEYATASHKCACGCGNEVVTPFTPTDWTLIFDGETITLTPSIGNWSYPCRSHYLIQKNMVVWAGNMSRKAIEGGRKRDKARKTIHYDNANATKPIQDDIKVNSQPQNKFSNSKGLLSTILRFLGFPK